MTRTAALVLLVVTVVAASCSSSVDNGAWCSLYEEVAIAGVAFDSTSNGSPEQIAAAAELEAASQGFLEVTVPEEIEADFDELKMGPDVADAGDSFSEAATRVGEWTIANCDYSAEILDLFETEGQ